MSLFNIILQILKQLGYLDSGVSHHPTPNASQLHKSNPYLGSEGITIGKSYQILIFTIGSGILKTKNECQLSVNSLLHAPHASSNLLTVQKLYANNNSLIGFNYNSFSIKDSTSKKVDLQGISDNGLYKVNRSIKKFSSSTYIASQHANAENDLQWHRKYGHPSFDIIIRVMNVYGTNHKGLTSTCYLYHMLNYKVS